MITPKTEAKQIDIRQKALSAAARLFLERGYTHATVRDIADAADVNVSAMIRAVGNKEDILCALVEYVLDSQFSAAKSMLAGITEDKILYYTADVTLQLFMAEHDEAIRNLYCAAYSMADSSELILKSVTERMTSVVFKEYLPNHSPEDFYQLEIASGSIIRGYMATPCTEAFPIDQKVDRFLETALRVYCVPEERINQAKQFWKQFDYPTIAKNTIINMLTRLQNTDLA